MKEAFVTFSQVRKKYAGGRIALQDVSFVIPKGSITGLIGPNGSGKSTCLRLMAGLLQPTYGEIRINDCRPTRRIAESVAYLPEQDVYYPFFTVGETIAYAARMYRDFDAEKAEDMLDFLGLDRGARTGKLSKGHRARLKIVLVLARSSQLVLLDEPLSGLDPMAREAIIKGLVSFVDLEKQTVVMTTHEVSEVEPLLDLAIVIQDGKLAGTTLLEELHADSGVGLVDWMKGRLHESF